MACAWWNFWIVFVLQRSTTWVHRVMLGYVMSGISLCILASPSSLVLPHHKGVRFAHLIVPLFKKRIRENRSSRPTLKSGKRIWIFVVRSGIPSEVTAIYYNGRGKILTKQYLILTKFKNITSECCKHKHINIVCLRSLINCILAIFFVSSFWTYRFSKNFLKLYKIDLQVHVPAHLCFSPDPTTNHFSHPPPISLSLSAFLGLSAVVI